MNGNGEVKGREAKGNGEREICGHNLALSEVDMDPMRKHTSRRRDANIKAPERDRGSS